MEDALNRREALCFIAALGSAAVSRPTFAQSPFLSGRGMPYAAFDALPKIPVRVKDGDVMLAFAPGKIDLPREAILDWIARAANSVTTYYGRFPVPSARLLIVPVEGSGVRGGTSWGYGGAAIRMLLGRGASREDLDADWMLTHEMVHLALPDVAESHLWLAEGLAVYIEPIARVQAGYLTPKTIWTDMARDMQKGLPAAGDRGLDASHSWASTYWGGALFCLLADIGYRRATGDRRGLQQAMRGVLEAGGDHEVSWPIAKILGAADKAAGAPVMAPLYDRMRAKAVMTDLPDLWRKLGVEPSGDGVRFHDDAPLAPLRLAITAPA